MPFITPERFVVFGDSFSDGGAIFDLTSEILAIPFPLASAGYAGPISNGPVYAQTLPTLLGAEAEIYAVGSARAVGQRPLFEVLGLGSATPPFDPGSPISQILLPDADLSLLEFDVNLQAQVARFAAAEQADPDPAPTVAAFNIGLNDLGGLDTGSPTVLLDAAALLAAILTETFGAAQAAIAAGADAVALFSFPVAEFFPLSASLDPAGIAVIDQFGALHAAGLMAQAATFNALGVPAQVVDLGALTGEIVADPETFGFLAQGPILLGTGTDPIVLPGDPLPDLVFPENPAVAGLDPSRVQFFDFLHPTTAMHDLFAVFSATSLTAKTKVLGDGDDVRTGSRHDDLILAGAGDDVLFMAGGSDVALGGLGADTLRGGTGRDLLIGGAGDDFLSGNGGRDIVAGGAGADLIYGGGGRDLLIDGLGSDRALGSGGDDVFLWTEDALIGGDGTSLDRLVGGAGFDTAFLLVSAASAGGAQAALESRSAFEIATGRLDLSEIGVRALGIEEFVVIEDVSEIDGVSPIALAQIADAGLWGLA